MQRWRLYRAQGLELDNSFGDPGRFVLQAGNVLCMGATAACKKLMAAVGREAHLPRSVDSLLARLRAARGSPP